ncbi:hypothetical protein BCR42DRAFT_37851 [Absidia repens]|uniref:Uncharacterized protein n=1 Tax=Absidia repens TaxID=90262 RepID=A0A1X2IHN6_9FUNG|nr:hypothetical protein BCR42DRAFT_37851 [Absidia repens]
MTTTQLPTLISSPLNILTLQDVILDSPIFRSNVEQVADQADLFEKWLDGFVRVLKSYVDSLSKTNTQTSLLCKQLVPEKNDYNFICNSQIAGQVINGFAGALETGLSAKVKLVNDLDETLLQPLQHLLKNDMKEFKDMRRTFEKSLDKYENHLSRYSNLSKQKEPSSLREDAFQMFDIQKTYIHASGTYFMQLITIKSKVEHLLVDCFSDGLTEHLDHLNESLQSQASARGMIPGWRQWLDESKATCASQLKRIQESTRALEDAHIRQIRPHRSLKRYSTSNNDQMVAITNSSTFESLSDDGNDPDSPAANNPKMSSSTSLPSTPLGCEVDSSQPVKSSSSTSSLLSDSSLSQPSRHVKQGYLFSRIVVGKPSRYSWVRRWFFLKDGWFGQYTVSTVNKVKGTMTINDRIPTNASCECRIYTDIDRRFCFEVTGSETSFFLQSETEQDMQQWLWAIERAKEYSGKEDTAAMNDLNIPRALLSPKANMTIRKSANDQSQLLVSLSVSPPTITSSTEKITNTKSIAQATDYLVNDLSTVSALTSLMVRESTSNPTVNADTDYSDKDSNTTSDAQVPSSQPATASSSEEKPNDDIPNQQPQEQQQQQQQPVERQSSTASSSWSMPWLMSGINVLSSSSVDTHGEPKVIVVWPNKVESDAPKVKLDDYSDDLLAGQRELRRYFACVPEDEIVMDVFSASLYRQPKHRNRRDSLDDGAKSGGIDKPEPPNQNMNDLGNGYSGTVYMSQKSLWFYSCRMMTCLNAVVIPYGSIKTIRLEKILSANSQGMLMYIDTKSNPSISYCFGVWLDSAELIAERLRVVTENAKRQTKMDDQVLFDIIRCTTIGKIRSKTPTSQVIAITTSNTAVTPLTVQAQSRLTTEPQATLDHTDNDGNNSPTPSALSSLSDSSNHVTTKLTLERQQQNASPAAGALTAAMEAANESRTTEFESKPPRPRKKSKNLGDSKDTSLMTQNPVKPVTCNCDDHLDKVEADLELPISARRAYEFLAGTSCWEQLNKAKGNSAPSPSKWENDDTGTMERILNYTMPSPMARGKEAEVIETQQVLRNENGLCYVILVTTKAPTLPYADAFIPMIKLCITYNSPTTCRLVCSIGVKWLKSIMVKGKLKSMVNRAAIKGMSETIAALTPIVEQTAAQEKRGGQEKQQMTAASEKDGSTKLLPNINTSNIPASSGGQKGDTKQNVEIGKWNILGDTALSPRWFVIFVSVALLLLLYPTWLMERVGLSPSTLEVVSTPFSTQSMGNVSWRAVHLSDLEPLVNGKDTEVNRSNSSAYQAFKSSRSDIGVWNYRWFSIRHRLTAAELTFTREQLAVIRYELLMAFKMLNGMEQRLLESEYWNWLLDQQSRCHLAPLDNQDNEDSTSATHSLCNEINAEIGQADLEFY